MSVTPRLLLTATAAGTLLCGLCFVPSAHAGDRTGTHQGPAATARRASTTPASEASGQPSLAETGSVDTTPYLIGGTAFLGIGAGFVTHSVRRGSRAL